MTGRIGAPGSVARHVQERLEKDPEAFAGGRWGVFEYTAQGIVTRALQSTRENATRYMSPGWVLVDIDSYR
jgi:hypothetical protein